MENFNRHLKKNSNQFKFSVCLTVLNLLKFRYINLSLTKVVNIMEYQGNTHCKNEGVEFKSQSVCNKQN